MKITILDIFKKTFAVIKNDSHMVISCTKTAEKVCKREQTDFILV